MVLVQYRPAGRNAKEISDSIESGIRSGALQPGTALPSVRVLAGELGVAPGTVAAAYKLLRDQAVVEARGRNGTYVRPQLTPAGRSLVAPIEVGVTDLASGQPDPGLLPGLHLLDLLSLAPVNGLAAAPDAFVLPELVTLGRQRLAADGVPAEAITLASGGLDGIHQVLSAHLRPGDVVAIEDPGWPNALDLIAALGLRPYPVPVDAAGPLAEPLRTALRAGARAVVVTSRAHNPTGAFLTPGRANELRTVLADHPQTVVIEDDHAAELADVELASLAGSTQAWAFIRSASKPYGPDLRVALITGDQATIARVDGRMRLGSGWVSTLLQRLVIGMWTSDDVAAVVAHAAETYDRRRTLLIAELAARGIGATGRTGLNVWVPVADETAVVTSLRQARWAVAPGARFRQASGPGVRITVSELTEATIPKLADDVALATAVVRQSSYTA
jgi:DNA-binding transcriptional MocR family regulator